MTGAAMEFDAGVTPPAYSVEWLVNLRRATLTAAEAGRVLNVTGTTVIRLIRAGELEGGRIGHKYWVSVAGLIRHLRT